MPDRDFRRSDHYTEPEDTAEHQEESAGDPREAQEPQEPRSTHVGSGRDDAVEEPAPRPIWTPPRRGRHKKSKGVVDELREVWDRMRGRG